MFSKALAGVFAALVLATGGYVYHQSGGCCPFSSSAADTSACSVSCTAEATPTPSCCALTSRTPCCEDEPKCCSEEANTPNLEVLAIPPREIK